MAITDGFLRAACLSYDSDPAFDPAAARGVLVEHPDLPSSDLAVAAVCGDVAVVRRLLARTTDVDARTGPYAWTALMYLAYGRLGTGDAVEVAELLLASGADPNERRRIGGGPTPFTVLTGVFGDGENGQPAHPQVEALARALLTAGADPDDEQTLYNRMFGASDDFLDLLFEFGLGRGDRGPTPDALVRRLLGWAVAHDQRERVALLARHGVDVVSPLPDSFGAVGTPIQVALANGHRELADLLRGLGADEPSPDPLAELVGAVLAADPDAVAAADPAVLAAARSARPGLLVLAASRGIAAVETALAAGWTLDALGRSDAPVEQPWQTALHTAVECDDIALVARLLELGADTSIRDARFGGTPLDWARHLGRPDVEALLAG